MPAPTRALECFAPPSMGTLKGRDSVRRRRPFHVLWMAAFAITLAGCGDDYRDANETDQLNAYFYYPRDSDRPEAEVYLGEVTGISACRRAAGSFAGSKNMTSLSGWSYICCRIAHGSSCYDKSK